MPELPHGIFVDNEKMPYKTIVKKDERWMDLICPLCKDDINALPATELPCSHRVHVDCIYRSIKTHLNMTLWDNWGVTHRYCPRRGCDGLIPHLCPCHKYEEGCFCKAPPIPKKLTSYEGTILEGYRFYGLQTEDMFEIELVGAKRG